MKHVQIIIDIKMTDAEFNSEDVQGFISSVTSGAMTEIAKKDWGETILGDGAMDITVTYGLKEAKQS
jgi:hypothetical protein